MHLEYPTTLHNRLVTWSEWHAFIMLIGVLLIRFFLPISVFPFWTIVSFIGLIVYCRHFWTPQQIFGIANSITAFRLVGILGLMLFPDFSKEFLILASIFILILDGVDGYLARKMNLASEFGEYFDKEVDALFMLTLCLLLYTKQQFGSWILIPGLMRYLFVLYLKFAKPPQHKEFQSSLSKWIFFMMMASLIFSFTPFSQFASPLTLCMTVLLGYSFFISIWRFHHA